jgi:hypothetical protein
LNFVNRPNAIASESAVVVDRDPVLLAPKICVLLNLILGVVSLTFFIEIRIGKEFLIPELIATLLACHTLKVVLFILIRKFNILIIDIYTRLEETLLKAALFEDNITIVNPLTRTYLNRDFSSIVLSLAMEYVVKEHTFYCKLLIIYGKHRRINDLTNSSFLSFVIIPLSVVSGRVILALRRSFVQGIPVDTLFNQKIIRIICKVIYIVILLNEMILLKIVPVVVYSGANTKLILFGALCYGIPLLNTATFEEHKLG